MISNIMWVPLEFPYSDPDNCEENGNIELKGMYPKLMEAVDEREQALLRKSRENGYVIEHYLRLEEKRCEELFYHLEQWGRQSKVL